MKRATILYRLIFCIFFLHPIANALPRLGSTKSRPQNEYICLVEVPSEIPNKDLQTPDDTIQVDSSWEKGTLIGSMSLVAGTAVGGGFLGLPHYTTKLGFLKSTSLIIATWIFLNAQAFVLIDLCFKSMKRNGISSVSIHKLACESFGSQFANILSSAFFFLLNATLVAQIAMAGNVLSQITPIPPLVASIFTAACIASVVFFGNKTVVEKLNVGLTTILVGAFSLLLKKALPLIRGENLTASGINSGGLSSTLIAFPVLLQLLKFHEIIPTICSRLGVKNVGQARKAVIGGSSIPLFMMLGWNAVACGLITPGSNADPLQTLLQSKTVGRVVTSIALTAMLTTIIGGYLSLEQFLRDIFEQMHHQLTQFPYNIDGLDPPSPGFLFRLKAGTITWLIRILTVIPSLLLAALGPGIFYAAIEFAGAYPTNILYCISPPLMTLINRRIFITEGQLIGKKRLISLIMISVCSLMFTAYTNLCEVLKVAWNGLFAFSFWIFKILVAIGNTIGVPEEKLPGWI
mmetsp:Transcript_33329/g.43981  ORF Transcript_33329/g.43981 Transcript_33329/m.43981 type:complete len:518 (-) Transcript_33329:473-2026(-)|eukprot:CAMPEP_0117743568 /NCGR_PEP_ID=MMETSP0947-20121206/6220_1 /TAXON_ID=44440 /ORGANISM="Chattonella subsalsa, Strain CCMP2191" /LENGTH=517 /DNA_ID=CAMNT_0005560309 /DNA_START=85 /DNA_END=1638 /DNA_ORIENTATION=+